MEMPQSIKTLPPETLDILRYYGRMAVTSAYPDDVIAGSGLSDRGFGKAIRRLITKSYMMMDGSQQYRLTESGRRVLADLLEYDLDPESRDDDESEDVPYGDLQFSDLSFDEPLVAPVVTSVASIAQSAPPASFQPEIPPAPRFVRRRAVLIAPSALTAGQPTALTLGLHDEEGSGDSNLDAPISLLVRVQMVHGEPSVAHTVTLMLHNSPVQQTFEITAGAYTQARVRVEICQDENDTDGCGGLFIDLPVQAPGASANGTASTPVAYGADLMLMV